MPTLDVAGVISRLERSHEYQAQFDPVRGALRVVVPHGEDPGRWLDVSESVLPRLHEGGTDAVAMALLLMMDGPRGGRAEAITEEAEARVDPFLMELSEISGATRDLAEAARAIAGIDGPPENEERLSISRASTLDNAVNLDPAYVRQAQRLIKAIIGARELGGELVFDMDPTLYREVDWNASRVKGGVDAIPEREGRRLFDLIVVRGPESPPRAGPPGARLPRTGRPGRRRR